MEQIKSFKELPDSNLVTGGSSLCQGCGAALGLKLALLALGKRTIIINASGCLTLQPTYPYTPFLVPWCHLAMENAAAAATGIWSALKALKKEKDINIVCYAGDGAAYDIGLQALSGAIQNKTNFIFICYNNSAFANTGVQMSSATPKFAYTTTTPLGNPFERKPITKILAAHRAPYVATACVCEPIDFINKLKKAAKIRGPKFIDLLTPCPTGWGFDPSNTIEIGREAVQSGAWPLYEIESGKFTLNSRKTKSVREYLLLQARFAHLKEREIKEIQDWINEEWKLLQKGRFWEAREY